MKYLVPVLADQLSLSLPSIKRFKPDEVIIVLAEVRSETDYAPHHRQKILFLFSAMRHFAQQLKKLGYQVHYTCLDDPENTHNLVSEWERLASFYHCQEIYLTEPGEWRLKDAIDAWMLVAKFKIHCLEDCRFLCSHQEFQAWAKGRKQLRMEYFYQQMRKKFNILVDEQHKPLGGRWNFDEENREPLGTIPDFPHRSETYDDEIIAEVKNLLAEYFPQQFGDCEQLYYAVTANQAQAHFERFLEDCLPSFGRFQDVMVVNQPYLYHAVISAYLNVGFLEPLAVCHAAVQRYQQGKAPLSAVEGFVRQILGWREYVRGIYWLMMPQYQNSNYFSAQRPLPALYWGGKTRMHCMSKVVEDTKKYAYSHHIQRLMITGNFALLTGLDPKAVSAWYLGVYVDAYEWVEMPNTIGMALFADGGLMASKPYAASARYIQKMSNFCQSCHYDPKLMVGENACPFNSLYWNFVATNEHLLQPHQRMNYVLANWRRFSQEKQAQILSQARKHLAALDTETL